MSDNPIYLSRTALAGLVDAFLHSRNAPSMGSSVSGPLPDPWQGYWARPGWWAALNPQPLPPVDSFRLAERMARAVIEEAIARYRGAITPAEELPAIIRTLHGYLDDWCFNKPRPWPHVIPRYFPFPPFPGPPVPDPDPREMILVRWQAAHLLIAGVQFHKMSEHLSGDLLGKVFDEGADRLIKAGLEKLTEGMNG